MAQEQKNRQQTSKGTANGRNNSGGIDSSPRTIHHPVVVTRSNPPQETPPAPQRREQPPKKQSTQHLFLSDPTPSSSHIPQVPSVLPRNDARLDPSLYALDLQQQRPNPTPTPAQPSLPAPSVVVVATAPGPEYMAGPQVSPPKPETGASATSHGSNMKHAQQQQQQQKSKLPHGLTVQELKEMTKARLQAEAASQNSSELPLGGSRPPQTLGRTPPSSEAQPHPVAPAQVLVAQVPPPPPPQSRAPQPLPQVLRPVSPVPPGFVPRGAAQQQQWPPGASDRTENWETLSTGAPAPGAGAVHGAPPHSDVYLVVPPNNSSSSSSFSAAPVEFVEANRRRAATLSPQFGISSVHGEPSLPTTAMTEANSGAFPVAARERAFSSSDAPVAMFVQQQPHSTVELRERDYLPASSHGHQPVALLLQRPTAAVVAPGSAFSAPIGNRARTSSATSLPPMSHTADEFGMDALGGSTTTTTPRFASSFGAVREDAPLLGTPSTPVSTFGLADVFRVSSFEKTPSPAAMISSPTHAHTPGDLPSMHNDRLHASDNRMRASTWSEPGSLFGSTATGNDFSDDLASILKLSGAEDTASSGDNFLSGS